MATKNFLIPRLPSTPLQPLKCDLFDDYPLEVYIKRDDLNHSAIQGNKWHKLKHNLLAAQHQNANTLITLGGAYSNHIAATAAAGQTYGFQTIGLIRGDELANRPEKWSPTLQQAKANGMTLCFLTRLAYRDRHTDAFQANWQSQFADKALYWLPEGGTNELAVAGFEDLITDCQHQCPDWTHLYCAVGTGGSLAGWARYAADKQTVIGVASLKQADYLIPEIETLSGKTHGKQWRLHQHAAGAGYGKENQATQTDREWFENAFGIQLDRVYTNKMVHGFLQDIRAKRLPKHAKVILYHSGGLQGNPADLK